MNKLTGLSCVVALALALAAAGCGGDKSGGGVQPTPTPDPNEAQSVRDARAQFPRFIDVQTQFLSGTCSPNPGVCHNSSNYPNLETAGNTIGNISGPCNLELPDRTQGWDSCERQADKMKAGSFLADIAFMTHIGPGTWTIGFRNPATVTASLRLEVLAPDNAPIFEPPADWAVNVALVTGTSEAAVTVGDGDDFIRDYVDAVLKTVVGGDPNGNGTWGAEDSSVTEGALIYPGSPERSYLWGRITNTVPGSRMPLANAPITNPGYVALACWIEGLEIGVTPDAEDPIDYDSCAFADAPIDYAVITP